MVDEAVAAYPLMRGAGLMLVYVGLGFLAAWFSGSRWYLPAIAGAILGLTCTGLAGLFAPPLPKLDLDLPPFHGLLRAEVFSPFDEPGCRVIHRRRGACHAGAAGG
jgi:hypothetical protein